MVQNRVADRVQAGGDGSPVDHQAAQGVVQPGHREHVGDRVHHRQPGPVGGDGPQDGGEHLRVAGRPEPVVGGQRRHNQLHGTVVTAPLAGQELIERHDDPGDQRGGQPDARAYPVVAAEIGNPALGPRGGGDPGADLRQPVINRRAAAGGIDHQVGSQVSAVGAHAGHVRRPATRAADGGEQPGDFHPAPHRDPRLGRRGPLQHPVDGGPPGHHRGQPLISRPARGVRQRARHLGPQRSLGHPGGQQARIYIRQVLDEKLTASGHDDMRLDDLRRRRAERRRGGGFHVWSRLEAVPLEDQDLVPGPGQQQPGEQARGTAPHNDDIQRVPLSAPTAHPHGVDTRVKRRQPCQSRRTRGPPGTLANLEPLAGWLR